LVNQHDHATHEQVYHGFLKTRDYMMPITTTTATTDYYYLSGKSGKSAAMLYESYAGSAATFTLEGPFLTAGQLIWRDCCCMHVVTG
jgi:hypothetical protein